MSDSDKTSYKQDKTSSQTISPIHIEYFSSDHFQIKIFLSVWSQRLWLNPQFYTTQNLKIYKLVYCRQKCEI